MSANIAKNIFCQNKAWWILITLLAALLILPGCQSTSSFYFGKQVDPEHVIPLPGGVENDKWSTFDLTITYSYTEDENIYNVNGQVELSDHYRMNYTSLRRLDVYLLFLDNHSTVLETARLASSYTHDLEASIPFTVRLPIPKNAVAFSFAYDGDAKDSDGKKGSVYSFWHLPKDK